MDEAVKIRGTMIIAQDEGYVGTKAGYDYSRDAIICYIPMLIKQLEEWKSL